MFTLFSRPPKIPFKQRLGLKKTNTSPSGAGFWIIQVGVLKMLHVVRCSFAAALPLFDVEDHPKHHLSEMCLIHDDTCKHQTPRKLWGNHDRSTNNLCFFSSERWNTLTHFPFISQLYIVLWCYPSTFAPIFFPLHLEPRL